jgi:phenylpropionate dioxygenase-like ring-hydroxylating dioxygenase large terminal subunit
MNKVSLRAFWHPIAATKEVTDQPKQHMLLGERLVAYRDSQGVVVFKDLCIHRGAELSGGKVEGDEIICPYHGWRYDRTGACTRIPSLQPGSSIPSKARVIRYEAREAYDLVWVQLSPSEIPFPRWPDDAYDRPDFRSFLVNTYDWNASAARVVENVLDFSHLNFVHKGYTELADGPIIKPYEVTRSKNRLEFAYEDGRLRREWTLEFPYVTHDRKSVINGGVGGTWSEGANPQPGDATILSFIASPVTDTRTRIYVIVGRNHSLDKPDADFGAGFDVVMEQDRVIVERQHPEQLPVDLSEELHIRYPDAAAVAYRRMLGELDQSDTA